MRYFTWTSCRFTNGELGCLEVDTQNEHYIWRRRDGSMIRPWDDHGPPKINNRNILMEVPCPWDPYMQVDEGL